MNRSLKTTVAGAALVALMGFNSIFAVSFFFQPVGAWTPPKAGTQAQYVGKLITYTESGKNYTHKLENRNIRFIFNRDVSGLVNKTVTVKVEYTNDVGGYKVLSLSEGNQGESGSGSSSSGGSGSTTTYTAGYSDGYLRTSTDSAYQYQLRSANDDTSKVIIRMRGFVDAKKTEADGLVGKKVRVSYDFIKVNDQGGIQFKNAKIVAI